MQETHTKGRKMNRILLSLGCICCLLSTEEAKAESESWTTPPEIGWFTPSIYLNAAAGDSSAEHAEELAVGHHDPTRTDGSVQGLELGLSMRAHKHLEGFATYNLHYGATEEWEGEWEEAFLKLANLPGGFEIRGGRMLARYGAQNATHVHSWSFVDTPLATGLLGEDGLSFDGGDATWMSQHHAWTFGAVAGLGKMLSHDHGHDEEHADVDHAHEEEEHEHEHGWDDTVAYGRLLSVYQPHDFVQWTAGLSLATGDNEDKETRSVYGADLTYQWRENGFEPGGKSLRWTTELFFLSQKAHHEEEHADEQHDELEAEHAHEEEEHDADHQVEDEDTFGIYSQIVYRFHEKMDAGLRIDFVEGTEEQHDRYRVSPAITYFPFSKESVTMRLQYNYDDLAHTEEHSVWAQLGLAWGGSEVR